MIDVLKQIGRGEPVFVAGIVAALLTGVGVNVAPDVVAQLIGALVPVVLALLARRHTTPAANPKPPEATAPVVTFAGRR